MRLARIGSVVAAGSLLVGGTVLAAPSANALEVPGASGRTQVTTAPGLASALLKNGILPYSVRPGGTDAITYSWKNGLQLTYGFPVTGLSSTADGSDLTDVVLGASVVHTGGLAFVNLRNFKRVKVSNFIIDVPNGQLTAVLTGFTGIPDGTRAPIFNLAIDPSRATIGNPVVVPGVKVTLTAVAAGALNASLRTRVFATDQFIGTAKVVINLS